MPLIFMADPSWMPSACLSRFLAPGAAGAERLYLIYEHLVLQADKRYGSAAATSVLTIVGVHPLLPVLIRTWRDFRVAAR